MASAFYDAIIVGTGFAAISAARQLAGKRILLLEGRARTGGRAYTLTEGVSHPIDLGSAQFHGALEGNPVKPVAESLGTTTFTVAGAGPPMIFGTNGALNAGESGSLLQASAAASYTPSSPPPPPTASLASVLDSSLSPELLSLARLAEVPSGIPLEQVAAKHWGFGKPIAGTDAAPIGGYSLVVDKLIAEIEKGGGEVKLSSEVTAVEDLGASKGVKVSVFDGRTFTARYVISTIPLGVMRAAPPKFSPSLSPPFKAALERTLNGTLEKIILMYDAPFWPNADSQVAYFLLPTTPRSADNPPSSLYECFSQTTFPVNNFLRTGSTPHPSLLLYVGAAAGEFISNYSETEIGEAMHEYLVLRFGAAKDTPAPKKTIVTRWLADPFSRGETSAPTSLTKSADGELGTPLDYITLGRSEWDGRLGFAGEHTVIDGRGSVSGAWISGEREGKRVALLL